MFEITNKVDNKKLTIYKLHQAKYKIKKQDYDSAREILERALNLDKDESLIYYFSVVW